MWRKLILLFVLFSFVYPVLFSFLPALSSRIYLGFCGIIFLIYNIIEHRGVLVCNNHSITFVKYVSLLLLIGVSTLLINQTNDIGLIKYAFTIVLYFCASVFVVTLFVCLLPQGFTFINIIEYFPGVFIIQYIFIILLVVLPDLNDFIYTFIKSSEDIYGESVQTYRFSGIGLSFFTGGVINCFSLLTLVFLYSYEKTRSKQFFYCVIYLIIVTVGSIVSRTTLIGVLLSVMYFVAMKHIKKLYGFIVNIAMALFMIYILIPTDTMAEYQTSLEYGFELFYKYSETGTFATDSSNELLDMRQIYPDNLKTWLIGDGRFVHPRDPDLYYMNTDVGYMRYIYYWGVIGTFVYFALLFFITSESCKNSPKYKLYFQFNFYLVLLLFFKGIAEYTSFIFFLFYASYISQNCKRTLPGSLKITSFKK